MTDTTSINHPTPLTSGDFTAAEEPFALFGDWFAEAAKACGSSLTRTCLMSKIATTTSWTGGGLTSQANPAANAMPACYVVLKITGSAGHLAFSRYEPASGFDCSPDNAPHIAP